MTYRQRLTLAAVCSVAAHLTILAPGGCRSKSQSLAFSRSDPIVLELQPEPEPIPAPPTQQLVDVLAPADVPADTTDLIAEHRSKAADTVDSQDGNAPRVEKINGFDRIAAPAPAPAPAPPPAPRLSEPLRPPDLRREKIAAAEPRTEPELVLQKQPPQTDPQTPPAPPDTPDAQPALMPAASSGRVEGGVKRTGLMAFEAMESEIAPYLKEVRQRVEKNWRTALHTRYSGTSRTRAVLDCAIGSDGHIISVDVIEPGDSVTFAPLCKEAIENAAPFGPFPFEVPEMYRSRNLEIRWTFSFLE